MVTLLFVLIVGVTVTLQSQLIELGLVDVTPEMIYSNELSYTNSEAFAQDVLWPVLDQIDTGNVTDRTQYIQYYYKTGSTEYGDKETLRKATPAQNDIWLHYENGGWQKKSVDQHPSELLNKVLQSAIKPDTFIIHIKAGYFQYEQKLWEYQANRAQTVLPYVIGNAIAWVLLILLIILFTGKEPIWLDKLFTELTLLAIFMGLVVWVTLAQDIFRALWSAESTSNYNMYHLMLTLFTAAATIWIGLFTLSFVRQIKSRLMIKNSFIYRLIASVIKAVKSFFNWVSDIQFLKRNTAIGSLINHQILYVALSAFLVLVTLVGVLIENGLVLIIAVLLEALATYWFFSSNSKAYKRIDDDLEVAISERLKTEHMKVELITNMSHDLKTPLTSIISYVDLISRDETLSDASREYITVLMSKSERLKQIVADLFDLSKSSSGNLTLQMETLDLRKMLEQVMANLSDEIEASELVFKTSLPAEAVMIEADGARLHRVFQNLFDNIFKYAMKGTRVYIDLNIQNGHALLSLKNTSAEEIRFKAEDILQRFTRGDEARHSEGSGLGLSIAESFTKGCGGSFTLSIDGDLFKTDLQFELAKPL